MKTTTHRLRFVNKQTIRTNKGLGLIEILVTVLVLSIGLLGIAATQTVGMSFNHDSYMRSQATMLLNELTERMSTNIVAVDANVFSNINTFNMATCGAPPAVICEGTAVACTPAQLATYDAFRMACGFNAGGNDGVVNIFPNGSIAITCIDSDGGVDADPCTDGSNHQIMITWQKPNMPINQVQMVVRP